MHKRLRRFLTGNRARIEEARALVGSVASSPETRVAAAIALATFEDAQSVLAAGSVRRGRDASRARSPLPHDWPSAAAKDVDRDR